jgi:glycerophosphoryl diester phosphodiesterase
MSHPEVIAHRGFTARHHENTQEAFIDAVELGVDAIELDVHATADDVVVVHHDAHLGPPLASQSAAIAELSWGDLQRHSSDSIPKLSQVLQAVGERATVYVEIKGAGIEALVCSVIGDRARCAVHAFDHRSIARCGTIAPALPRGVLMTSYLLDPYAPLRDTYARDLWQHWELIDEDLVAGIHAQGGRVIAWTVNSVDAARRLAAFGVDGICTDRSDVMIDALRVVASQQDR